MPSGVSDDGSRIWLSALFGVAPAPSGYYVALCASAPTSGMDGDLLADLEPADASYVRQPYGVGASQWGANGQLVASIAPVSFPTPTDDWGYVTHFALCSAPTSGLLYAWGEFLNPQFVSKNVGVTIPAGAMIIGLHGLDETISA